MSTEHPVTDKKDDSYSNEKIYEHDAYAVESAPAGHAAGELKRQLKNRHIAMISIGGVIGTGLFLVSPLIFSTPCTSLISPRSCHLSR